MIWELLGVRTALVTTVRQLLGRRARVGADLPPGVWLFMLAHRGEGLAADMCRPRAARTSQMRIAIRSEQGTSPIRAPAKMLEPRAA